MASSAWVWMGWYSPRLDLGVVSHCEGTWLTRCLGVTEPILKISGGSQGDERVKMKIEREYSQSFSDMVSDHEHPQNGAPKRW